MAQPARGVIGHSGPHETFHWSECAARLEPLVREHEWQLESAGRYFEAHGLRLWPPAVFPIPPPLLAEARTAESAMQLAVRRKQAAGAPLLARYQASLPAAPGLHCLILLQAGAASSGMFECGEALCTKSHKRYVVRGKGRAQPSFLASKGKSRYGSRLRLQNARRLAGELNAKLQADWLDYGAPQLIFASAPKRLWPDLMAAKPAPPFGPEHPIERVPLDLPVPTTAVLLRTYRSLCHGRIEWH